MKSRFLGAILLIAGTTIGAAMLALPVTAGLAGLFPSCLIFLFLWLFMLLTGFYILEITLRFPGETNLISMVRLTLGRKGEVCAWVVYLLLLYALISAYLVGGSQILSQIFPSLEHQWSLLQSILFACILYFGIGRIDWLNRIFMVGLVIGYVTLVWIGAPYISLENMTWMDYTHLVPAISIILTSFGFQIVIPSLTEYLHHDVYLLKKALFIGSFIPFLVYLIWQTIVLGIIPLEGDYSLNHAHAMGIPVIHYLFIHVANPWIFIAGRIFALCAIVTSLLGVILSLSDFLFDGLHLKKQGLGKFCVILFTLAPPLLFAYGYPHGFILALHYAGIFVAILLGLLPALMVYYERYRTNRERHWIRPPFVVIGGKPLVLCSIVISIILLIIEVIV